MRLIICVFFKHAQNCQTIGLMTQSHKADALAPVTAGAGPASTAGAGPASITATLAMVSPAEPLAATAGSSTARLLRETGVFRTQLHGGTRRCALPFWWPNSATKWQALQPTTAGAAALDAFDAATLDTFGDLARGVPYNNRFQFRTRTSNSQHTRVEYTTKERLAHDPRTLPGEVFGAPAH